LVLLVVALLSPGRGWTQWTEAQGLPSDADLTTFHFTDPSTGLLIGKFGDAFRTVDGMNWTRIIPHECKQCLIEYDRLLFFGNEGFLYGMTTGRESGSLYLYTTDAGSSWTKLDSAWDRYYDYVSKDYGLRLAGIQSSYPWYVNYQLLRTKDLGKTSDSIHAFGASIDGGPGGVSVSPVDSVNWLVYEYGSTSEGDQHYSYTGITTDGGRSWNDDYHDELSSQGKRRWLGRKDSALWHSTDGGTTWRFLAIVPSTFKGLRAINSTIAFCEVNQDSLPGMIGISQDSGRTWRTEKLFDSAFTIDQIQSHYDAIPREEIPTSIYALIKTKGATHLMRRALGSSSVAEAAALSSPKMRAFFRGGRITVHTDSPAGWISLHDVLGHELYRTYRTASDVVLEVGDLSNGVYLIAGDKTMCRVTIMR
jgi:hypothetical protein